MILSVVEIVCGDKVIACGRLEDGVTGDLLFVSGESNDVFWAYAGIHEGVVVRYCFGMIACDMPVFLLGAILGIACFRHALR